MQKIMDAAAATYKPHFVVDLFFTVGPLSIATTALEVIVGFGAGEGGAGDPQIGGGPGGGGWEW